MEAKTKTNDESTSTGETPVINDSRQEQMEYDFTEDSTEETCRSSSSHSSSGGDEEAREECSGSLDLAASNSKEGHSDKAASNQDGGDDGSIKAPAAVRHADHFDEEKRAAAEQHEDFFQTMHAAGRYDLLPPGGGEASAVASFASSSPSSAKSAAETKDADSTEEDTDSEIAMSTKSLERILRAASSDDLDEGPADTPATVPAPPGDCRKPGTSCSGAGTSPVKLAPGAYEEGLGRETVRLQRSMPSTGVIADSTDGLTFRDLSTSAVSVNSGLDLEANDTLGPEQSTGELIEAHMVEDMVECQAEPLEQKKWTHLKVSCLVLGSLIVLGGIIAISIFLTSRSQKGDPDTLAPTLAPSLSPGSRLVAIAEIVTNGTETTADLLLQQDSSSPQLRALEWIAWDDAYQIAVDDVEHVQQRFALAVLYFSTGGANWTDTFEILKSNHECTWSGALRCDGQTVTGIGLNENNLVGQLPSDLRLLPSLRYICMNGNRLTGTLPSFLPQLTRLDLWDNALKGGIPTSYTTMTDLVSLRVGKNSLTGNIPEELGILTKLTSLSLEANSLTGKVPDSIWNLDKMENFEIGQQALSGTLSPLVGRWINASIFHTNKMNGITGSIPSEFGLLTRLSSLKFSQNHLRGTLPSELGNLKDVTLMAISRNGISGTVPSEFGRLSKAREIYLQNTWLEGNTDYLCNVKANGGMPDLKVFNVDMEEVNCTCCTCCEY